MVGTTLSTRLLSQASGHLAACSQRPLRPRLLPGAATAAWRAHQPRLPRAPAIFLQAGHAHSQSRCFRSLQLPPCAAPEAGRCAALRPLSASTPCGGLQVASGRGAHTGPMAVLDPGRAEIAWEYLADGTVLLDLPLEVGGSLQVTAHRASEQEAPPGALPGSLQEWRVLRFTPAEGTTDLYQSITKVCIAPSGPEPRVCLRSEVLPLAYTKSFAAVVLATLTVLGAPVLPAAAAAAQRRLRILCIGLGGGSLPSFFASALPHCEVDVVEREPAVLQAALQAMGFARGPRLRVAVGDGAEAALAAAAAADEDGVYDAVLVDAYDAGGAVPSELWSPEGGLARALAGRLLRRQGGLVATNFLPHVDLAPPLAAYRTALAAHGAGPGFSVQANRPDGQEGNTGNRIAVQTSGGPAHHGSLPQLRGRLSRAAAEVGSATRCPFDMADLAARGLRLWPHA
mmetsp:Transcript_74629/g.241309  ORF Transcript_74629/g.241309 Transcript_74629/m.241309 type:complete len:456 (-) Transcript_74629:64-1431(-)